MDEVGRGCLAGPVVTAAVVLPLAAPEPWWDDLNDSKLVAPAERKRLSELVGATTRVQVAWCFPEEIDRLNILQATMLAMRRAVSPFSGYARVVLVDGNMDPFDPRFRCNPDVRARFGFEAVETLVQGDRRSVSIAAASIVAKAYRDDWMAELDEVVPGYGFRDHKGYSTPDHRAALRRLGPSALHRRSFAPVRESLAGPGSCNASEDGRQSRFPDRSTNDP